MTLVSVVTLSLTHMESMNQNSAAHDELAREARRKCLEQLDLSDLSDGKVTYCTGGMDPEYLDEIDPEMELSRLPDEPYISLPLTSADREMLDYERANPKRTPEKFRDVNRRFGQPWPLFLAKVELILRDGADAEYPDVAARLAATPSAEIYNPEP